MNTNRHALRLWIVAASLTVPLFGLAPAAHADSGFSGDWRVTSGNFEPQGDEVRIWQDGDRLKGEYSMKDGRLSGHDDGNQFEGIWFQSSANRACYDSRMGSRYWGRFWIRLNGNEDRFDGRWSYCDDAPGSAGEWHGERHRHLHD